MNDRASRIARQTFPADHMRKLNLPCKRVQREKGNHYEEEEIIRVRRRNPNAISEHNGTITKALEKPSRKHGGMDNNNMAGPSFKRSSIIHLSNSDWARLPNDIMFSILDKLLEPIEHVRFAMACKQWRYVAKDYNRTTQRWNKVLPMLMIPIKCHLSLRKKFKHGLYGVLERNLYNSTIRLPDNGERCCGFSHGWLATIDKSWKITLHNLKPNRNTSNVIHLPPVNLLVFKFYSIYGLDISTFVPRVILSHDPTSDPENFAALVFFNDCMPFTYIRGRDKHWTYRTSYSCSSRNAEFVNAMSYRNQIHTVRNKGHDITVTRLDYDPCCSLLMKYYTARNVNHPEEYYCERNYLVESTKGDLLLVRRFSHFWETITTFMVYKLVLEDTPYTCRSNTLQMIEVEDIGDDALFIGHGHSVSVLASNHPGCKPNSIYYTHAVPCESGDEACAICIFNLENRTITQIDSLRNWDSGSYAPFWFLPSLV